MSIYNEKLFRLKYGYHELKGDEICAPYLEDHYRNVKCVSDLSLSERTAWYAREQIGDGTPPGVANKIIDRVVYKTLEDSIDSICSHAYRVISWSYDNENMHWWNTWFGLKPKYIVILECSICRKTEVHKNLSFKEFCELMISINLKERLS